MSVHGGKRPGAGRKKGAATRRTQEIVDRAAAEGETPLEYMLRVMRTSSDDRRRDAMAVAAASYVHPKLAAIEHTGETTHNIVTDKPMTPEEWQDAHADAGSSAAN